MSGGETYLDHAATTPLRPEALEAMMPWLTDRCGNPSGAHKAARAARRAIDDARDVIADALGREPGEIVFSSGGTESDNLAVYGVHEACGGVAVCTAFEHHAVIEPVEQLGGRLAPATRAGVIDLAGLADVLDDDVTFVSVMAANNETGVIQPIQRVREVVAARAPRAVTHVDAVQAFAWLDLPPLVDGIDLVSVTAHKLGGPQGVGVLAMAPGAPVAPRQIGGGQERDRRSGTQNVAGIVGMGAAVAAMVADRETANRRVRALRDRLLDGLIARIDGAHETAAAAGRDNLLPGHAHLLVDDLVSETLLVALEQEGVYASAAASCASGAQEPSHVLAAMGIEPTVAQGALRLSLGTTSTDTDVDRALEVIPRAVERVRGAP